MYCVYLLNADDAEYKPRNFTSHTDALVAFSDLIHRRDLEGCKAGAGLSYQGRDLAFHRFDCEEDGELDWRGKLGQIAFPIAGRPALLQSGKRVNVYLDAESLERAAVMGHGNVSEGIRIALANAAQTTS